MSQTKPVKDSPIPIHRNLKGYKVEQRGTFPRTEFFVVFDYEDGCQREYRQTQQDGAVWTVTKPSDNVRRQNEPNLFAAA